MDQPSAQKRKALLIKLALVAFVLVAGGLAVLAGLDVKALVSQGLALIQGAGPVAFFAAMAILPGLGVPILTFDLTVGSAFTERLGMPLVLALSLTAITFNLTVTYCLARWLLRPWLQKLIDRLGYRMPEAGGSDGTDLLVILRVTPGIPFLVQNYLAGLANIPFGRYLVISCLISWSTNTAFIVFGEALVKGKGSVVLVAVSAIVALLAITHMVRRHYAAKKAAA